MKRAALLGVLLLSTLSALCLTGVAAAQKPERRALLVGVSHYNPPCPDPQSECINNNLDGPRNDIESMRQVLKARFGFLDGEITVLQDGEAIKPAVLAALRSLADWARPGREIFFYFSGHGTSNFDEGNPIRGLLPDASGVLVLPSPVQPPPRMETAADLLEKQYLVGRTEVRPLLQKMDQAGAHVIAVVDACFSENSLRSASARERRFRSPGREVHTAPRPNTSTLGQRPAQASYEPWPYTHVAWISASSANEPAADLRGVGAEATFDGRPHGALTDALLRVLLGQEPFEDSDGRHTLSYAELFKAAASYIRRTRLQQQPQVMPSRILSDTHATAVLELPVFGRGLPLTGREVTPEQKVVKVALIGTASRLHAQLQLPGIRLTEQGAEYRIEAFTGGSIEAWKVRTGMQEPVELSREGTELPQRTEDLVQSLRLRGLMRQLAADAKLRSSGLTVDLAPEDPNIGETLRAGQPLKLMFKASRDVTVALVHLMGDGSTRVWIPGDSVCLAPPFVKANTPTTLCTWTGSAPPYGLDLVYVLAAEGKAPALEGLTDREVTPAVEAALQEVVARHPGRVAMLELSLFTVNR